MYYLNWDMQFMLGLSAAIRYASVNKIQNDTQFMLGLSAVFVLLTSVRVSNELGAGNPRVAKLSVVVVNVTTILISLVLCVIVLVFRVGLSKAFTSDAEVIAAVSDLFPLLAVSIFLNGIQPILSGKRHTKETFL